MSDDEPGKAVLTGEVPTRAAAVMMRQRAEMTAPLDLEAARWRFLNELLGHHCYRCMRRDKAILKAGTMCPDCDDAMSSLAEE